LPRYEMSVNIGDSKTSLLTWHGRKRQIEKVEENRDKEEFD